MKTLNSISGGKTSAYLAANYPADYNVFSLVRTTDERLKFKDEKIRLEVEDRLQAPFIGTLEFDEIIYTILDLEQYIGKKIDWVTGPVFDDIIKRSTGKTFLPNIYNRFCTIEMKIEPMKKFWFDNIGETMEQRLGFRANEEGRAKRYLERCEEGILFDKFKIGKHKNGNNKWKKIGYAKPRFPLVENGVFKDQIHEYWKDKLVRFAYMNNCVGCFHRNEGLLNHMSHKSPDKFNWFVDQETDNTKWRKETSYQKIKNMFRQTSMFEDDDFNECDSGYCGL